MEPDTIQPDVPPVPANPDTPAAPEVSREVQMKNDREAAMERLAARHTQIVAEENGDVFVPDPAPADQLAAQLSEPATPPAAIEPAPAAAAPPKVKVKVDGVEAEVPFDEVVRNYQKTAAADRKLAEAARMQREAAELQAQIVAQQHQFQQQLQQQTQPPPTESPDTPVEPDESGRAFLKALFEGDEEAALAKLTELTAKGRQQAQPAAPTLDVDQLAQQVSAHVQQKLVVESALAKHRQDYPEIYADPDMEAFVLTKVNSRRAESQEDFFTALNSVSEEFATKFGWSRQPDDGRPSEPTPTTPARVTKLERKAQIDNVSSINTKTTSTEALPEHPSDIIAQMRKQRLGS